jgi:PAS domain S-box-containing protein
MDRPRAAQDAAAVNGPAVAVLVVPGGAEPPVWAPAGATFSRGDAALDAASLRGFSVALVDATAVETVTAVRTLRALDSALHIIIIAPPDEWPALERTLLFTPGVGEVWIRDADGVNHSLLEEASAITASRRDYMATRAQLETALSGVGRAGGSRHTYISDAYLAALLQVLPDPLLSLDEDGCVASWSPATEQCLSLERGSTRGRALGEVVRPLDPAALERLLDDGREKPVSADLEWRHADGDARMAHVTVTPVAAAGRHVRAVLFRDTTEQHAARQQLEAQAAELEAQAVEMTAQRDSLARLAAERMRLLDDLRVVAASRTRFYASMSHEIRTPVNAILGYNDLLLAGVYGDLNGEQQQALQRSQSAARHLRELVNDVLDLSKIEAGKIEIVMETVVLAGLIDEVVATMGPAAAEKESAIEVMIEAPVELETDPRRVRQVLLNLLSNAVKFGAGDRVEVRAGRLSADRVYVAVQDSGTGIDRDKIDRIFDEFVQLEAPGGEGTGLGLAISRRLANMLGGSLAVASTPGVGSTFTLVLPASPPHQE